MSPGKSPSVSPGASDGPAWRVPPPGSAPSQRAGQEASVTRQREDSSQKAPLVNSLWVVAQQLPAGVHPVPFFTDWAVSRLSGGASGTGFGRSAPRIPGAERPFCPWSRGPEQAPTPTRNVRPELTAEPVRTRETLAEPAHRSALVTTGLTPSSAASAERQPQAPHSVTPQGSAWQGPGCPLWLLHTPGQTIQEL